MDRPPLDEPAPRSRARDLWQLHIPLAIALVVCSVATVVELRRASEGNWRAWVYSVEWPIIGAFCLWMWFRFRRQGASLSAMTQHWRDRVAAYEEEARAAAPEADDDPDLVAWREYQRRLREGGAHDQPG